MNIRNIVLVGLTFVFLSGCNAGVRSGTIDDDYIEEPISNSIKKYESALEVSNTVLEYFKSGEFQKITSNYITNEMKKIMGDKNIRTIFEKVEQAMGPIETYKKMQWGFLPKNIDGQDILVSVKIVEHEKGMMNYYFLFKDDGNYKKLVGVTFRERHGVRFPSRLE